jgi:DNA adenine methylase
MATIRTPSNKPLVKWVGGKSQIIDHILNNFPLEIENYHEPFLGGGSVLLAVLSSKHIKIKGCVFASDSNKYIITMFKCVKMNPQEYIDTVGQISVEYPHTKEDYYRLRTDFNAYKEDDCRAAAMFLVLNKLCFRGVYREGPNGFNVPWGNSKVRPLLIDTNHAMHLHTLIKNVHFTRQDYSQVSAGHGDFIYFDPPYVGTFAGYTKGGFIHLPLFSFIKEVSSKGVGVLMSNSNDPLVHSSFSTGWKIDTIVAKRAINSKNPAATALETIVSKTQEL